MFWFLYFNFQTALSVLFKHVNPDVRSFFFSFTRSQPKMPNFSDKCLIGRILVLKGSTCPDNCAFLKKKHPLFLNFVYLLLLCFEKGESSFCVIPKEVVREHIFSFINEMWVLFDFF